MSRLPSASAAASATAERCLNCNAQQASTLTVEYLRGKRVTYTPPFRLYIVQGEFITATKFVFLLGGYVGSMFVAFAIVGPTRR